MKPDDDMEAILNLVANPSAGAKAGPYEPGQITAHQVWAGYPPDDNKVDLSVYVEWKMTDHFQEYAIFQSPTGMRWHFVNLSEGVLYGRWPSHGLARMAMRNIVLDETGMDIKQVFEKVPPYMATGGPVAPKKKPKRSYASMVTDLGKHIPGFYDIVACPVCTERASIYEVVQHLNDSHKWPRSIEAGQEWERNTADWLEGLDADLTVHQDEVKHTLIDWTKPQAPLPQGTDLTDLLEDGKFGPPGEYAWIDEAAKMSTGSIEALAKQTATPKHFFIGESGKISPTYTEDVTAQLEALQQALEPVKQAWGEIQTAMQQLVAEFKKIDMSAFTLTPDAITEEDTEDEHEDH